MAKNLIEWLNEDVCVWLAKKPSTNLSSQNDTCREVKFAEVTGFKSDFTFVILGGNFSVESGSNKGCVVGKTIVLPTELRWFTLYGQQYDFSEIVDFKVISQENRRGMGNVVGWGTLGLFVAGPIGAVGLGALANSRKDWVQFSMTLSDGKRFLAEIKSKDFAKFEFALDGAGQWPEK
jgi:hypothetical protein